MFSNVKKVLEVSKQRERIQHYKLKRSKRLQIEKIKDPAVWTKLVIFHKLCIVRFIFSLKVIKNNLFHFTVLFWCWWPFGTAVKGSSRMGDCTLVWKAFWIYLFVFTAVFSNQTTGFLKKSQSKAFIGWLR